MTSALHAEGPRFDPGLVYFLPQSRARAGGVRARAERRQTGASIAQMVERKTLNLVVVGSIPTGGAFFLIDSRFSYPPYIRVWVDRKQ